ncbi:hypothetical protein [Streptomyces sp. Tu 3180]|uniref:hypothetical protein n=1 Tax=Streptomyces sp. Tu 3180 TaxID=2682611 RepID=UPI0013590D40|nr:hypothetical protein [Streptomyces sp. Tu 3180]KAF3463254.1 hypothetical protein GL259_01845 [Streptomyces sp. Tu 3180]
MKRILGMLAATTAAMGALLTPASAAGQPVTPKVTVAADADSETRAWAAANPQEAVAQATECGGNYNTLVYIDGDLPGDVNGDDGSMAAYAGGGLLCVIFKNETPGNANYMFLQACPGTSASSACGTDDGYYSEFAGPLYISQGTRGCWTASYKMKTEAEDRYLINGKRSYSC